MAQKDVFVNTFMKYPIILIYYLTTINKTIYINHKFITNKFVVIK